MSFQYVIIGPLAAWLTKKIPAALKKIFKLQPIDETTKMRVAAKRYPVYYKIGYALWVICIFSTGLAAFCYIAFYLSAVSPGFHYALWWKYALLGLINMIGAWFIAGAALDWLFWRLSSDNFRDYVRRRCVKDGFDIDVPLQVKTLWKIGVAYYILFFPIIYLLVR